MEQIDAAQTPEISSGSAAPAQQVRYRAYRFCLDPTEAQVAEFHRLVGASRMAYNSYVAEIRARKQRWDRKREELQERGFEGEQLRRELREAVAESASTAEPLGHVSAYTFATEWLTPAKKAHRQAAAAIEAGADPQVVMSDDRYEAPWLHDVHRRVQVSGLRNAEAAWKNWRDSGSGKRAGRPVGFPRFKRRGVGDSFTICQPPTKMGARGTTWGIGRDSQTIEDYRHIYAAPLKRVRTHDSTRRLVRSLDRGARIKSYTLSRGAQRWYISFLVEEPYTPQEPNRAQRARGTVGVDLGVKVAAALSTGEFVENPRHGKREQKRITRLQRKIARTQKGSNRRARLVSQLAATHHRVAKRRETHAHRLTKTLTTGYARVGIEDLNTSGMTASARGTVEEPGSNVKAKAGLNRSILDASFSRIRRQLEYKAGWYGSELVVTDRFHPSSKRCSACGTVKSTLSLDERVFVCDCGVEIDRDLNAARNIAAAADSLARDARERLNGRRDPGQAAEPSAWVVEASRPPGRDPRGSPGASDCAPLPA